MIETFIGLLRNTDKVTPGDVELYTKNHDGLTMKMNKIDVTSMRQEILDKHFETLKGIQKYFIDSTVEGFKQLSDYAAFVAWGLQFIVYCKEAQAEAKLLNNVAQIEKQINQTKIQRETYQSILA